MQVHAIYLAIIAVLIIALVYAAAKAVRAKRVLIDVEERFGTKRAVRASLPRKGGEHLRVAGPEELLKPRTYEQYRREVDAAIERAHALEEFGPKTRLADACSAALRGGKRLRAVIALETARATSALRQRAPPAGRGHDEKPAPVDALEVALFLEYTHAASLVVDDLPEFDGDLVRRGRPSLHAEVGVATAQMAALALVAAAFQNMCRQVDWLRDNCPELENVDRIGTLLCGEVSRALGALGAAGGQYMDLSAAEDLFREHGPDAVAELMYRKTATLFELAVVMGWLSAGGEPEQMGVMRDIGRHLGTAFQIADDVGDMASDQERAARGKPGWNFANVYGRDVALREVGRNLNGARLLLTQCGLWTPLWERELFPLVRAMAAPSEPAEPRGAAPAEPRGPAPAEPRGSAAVGPTTPPERPAPAEPGQPR